MPFRIGHGFDLHRLEPGLPLILGGLELKHERGCVGHSDGDAVFHCVVDAILGALALPDIGQLFPDTDPRFKGCASHVFMTAAYERMIDEGYEIGNLDVTVILERPKMSPHKMKMRENIARLLNTPIENVNLKAKTHEKVDALGENRAVSVHAVTTLVPRSSSFSESADTQSVATDVTKSLLRNIESRVASVSKLNNDSDAPATTKASTCAVQKLYDVIESKKGADSASSWTAKLFAKGRKKIAEKVGEEAVEVVIDAVANDRASVVKESADLLYHLNVLWADMGIKPDDVWAELASREGTSGIAEKKARAQ